MLSMVVRSPLGKRGKNGTKSFASSHVQKQSLSLSLFRVREVNIFVLPRRRAILFLSGPRVRAHFKNMEGVGKWAGVRLS